jgi:type VI secretion system protein ImpH
MFGLMGPNGPLPLHLTEYARDRLKHHNDPTFVRFLDTLQHRFIALFYRAWAQAQPHVNYDRPKDDRFAVYLGAFAGLALESTRERDAVADEAKRFFAGRLSPQPRSAEGLRSVLAHYFRVPVAVQEFVGHWMPLAAGDHTRLSHDEARLGMGAVIGARVWDRQHKFRVHIGPLDRSDYENFLPGGTRLRALVDWVRLYLNLELEWDVRLVLKRTQVPPLKLGTGPRLGWTTWLGHRRAAHDANDLCLNAEAFSGRSRPL